MKKKPTKFSPEVRERAVRMVFESRSEYGSQWAAIESIAPKIGCSTQTLCNWVRRHERDTGQRDGMTTAEAARIKQLEPDRNTLIHHSDRGAQYISIRYSERLGEAGIEPAGQGRSRLPARRPDRQARAVDEGMGRLLRQATGRGQRDKHRPCPQGNVKESLTASHVV